MSFHEWARSLTRGRRLQERLNKAIWPGTFGIFEKPRRRGCCLREVVANGGSAVWMFSLGPKIGSFHENKSTDEHARLSFFQWICYLYFHASWMNDLDFIAIAAPHFVVHHCHTTNGMVRATEIQQVVIVEVPLTICKEQKQVLPAREPSRYWFFSS